jgi:hypothetical protein
LTTEQLQERALLLLSYSFLHKIFEQQDNKNLELKNMSETDLMFKQIYKKLSRIKKSFTNNETRDFLLKNVPDNISKNCDIALVVTIILAWFKRFNLTKEFLIIDELGYFKLNELESNLFFQIVNKKYETSSLIITTNLNFIKLKEVFNDNEALTTAILDRLIHHSYIINIQGESFRLREKKKAGLLNFSQKNN